MRDYEHSIARGADALDRLVADAQAMVTPTHQPAEKSFRAGDSSGLGALELLNCADVVPEPVRWLWLGWLAAGKLHILAGAPGTGKTTIALALAATLSAGGRWPDGTAATAGEVLVWSGEDDAADTLAPRLIATKADTSRIHFSGAMRDGSQRRPFDPATDMQALRLQMASLGKVCLLIVDPVVSAVAADSHKNTEVRRALQPLVDIGAEFGCAVLGISHFSKGTAGRDPVERVTGSIAFGAVARVVLAAARLPDEGERKGGRLLARAKSNIGPDTGGFGYDLEQVELQAHPGIFASRVMWGQSLDGSARELLAQADSHENPEEQGALADAKSFLLTVLEHGPVPPKQIYNDARDAGHAERTIKRAKKDLGIHATKGGMREGWIWQIPAKGAKNTEEGCTKRMAPFDPLRRSVFDPAENTQNHGNRDQT